jgi:hypothetical protein
MKMENEYEEELKGISLTSLSSTYGKVVYCICFEMRPRQIAKELRMSEEGLNYYLRRLKEWEIIIAGPRTSYRPYYINPSLKGKLKEVLDGFNRGPKTVKKLCRYHRIWVKFHIRKNDGFILNEKSQLKNTDIYYETRGNYRIQITDNFLMIHIPAVYSEGPSLAKNRAISVATIIAKGIVDESKGKLEIVYEPIVSGEFAIVSDLATLFTKYGDTMRRDGAMMDGSPSTSGGKIGEVEFSDPDEAAIFMNMSKYLKWIMEEIEEIQLRMRSELY